MTRECSQIADANSTTVGEALKVWACCYHQCRIIQHGLVEAINESSDQCRHGIAVQLFNRVAMINKE